VHRARAAAVADVGVERRASPSCQATVCSSPPRLYRAPRTRLHAASRRKNDTRMHAASERRRCASTGSASSRGRRVPRLPKRPPPHTSRAAELLITENGSIDLT
jgi:hypothetical protein